MMATDDHEDQKIEEQQIEPKHRRSLHQMQIDSMKNEGGNAWACPSCGCCDLRVSNTWVAQGIRKRLRKCRNCGTPIATCEKFE